MQYTTLGRTNVKISKCCLGTMTWGKQNNEADGHSQMDYALEHGINFWDTAEMYAVPPSAETYGTTETIIGTWFAKNQTKRSDVVLASKISPTKWVRGGAPIDSKNIELAVNGSLERLQTDYIDLYQLHWPTNRGNWHFDNFFNFDPTGGISNDAMEANLVDVLQGIDKMMKAGKIRYFGLSDDSSWGIMKYLQLAEKYDLPRVQSIQNEHSLICRKSEPDVAEACYREDVSFLPWSPLAMGVLSGKYLGGKRPEGTRMNMIDHERNSWRMNPTTEAATQAYVDLARKHGLDPCQMALAFVNQQKFVTSTIIGATSMEQLKTNIVAFDITLSPEVIHDIEELRKSFPIPY